jgi:hypothetical protein
VILDRSVLAQPGIGAQIDWAAQQTEGAQIGVVVDDYRTP